MQKGISQKKPATPDSVEEAVRLAQEWRKSSLGQKPTINDIAKVAGVSKKTISRIFNDSPSVREQTRQVVKAIMSELDYIPNPQARGLNFNHAFLVGLIYDNPNPQYVVTAQEGILDVLKPTEYELLVHPCNRSDPEFIQKVKNFIQRQRLYGVILTPSVSEDEGLAKMLQEIGCRHIRIASVALGAQEHMLVTYDAIGAQYAAEYLIEIGHTRIGYLSGQAGFRSSEQRQKGLEAGLAKAKLTLDPDCIIEGNYRFESGLSAVDKLFDMQDPPTAIFCANDQMAAGFLQGLRLSGRRAPDDISVIGYDDFRTARNVWPRLTTIHTPTSEFARIATYRLMDLEIPAELKKIESPWLVVRESTGPPSR